MSLIKSLAEASTEVDEKALVTRAELRDILSKGPIPALVNQANFMAQQVNNLVFRFDTLVEYLAVRGLRKGPDTRFYLDGKDWNWFLERAIAKQNADVQKRLSEQQEKLKAAAANPN